MFGCSVPSLAIPWSQVSSTPVPPFQRIFIPSEYVLSNQPIVFLLSPNSMAVKDLQDLHFMTGPVADLSAEMFIPLGPCYFFSELTSLAHKPQLI